MPALTELVFLQSFDVTELNALNRYWIDCNPYSITKLIILVVVSNANLRTTWYVNRRDFARKYHLIDSERFASIVALSLERKLLIEGHISVN